ncbi:MAG: hypothetical protein RLZZ591_350 [Pseudomonadota bacterium]|jgi:TonB family protein
MHWPVRKKTLAVLVAVSAIHTAGIFVVVPSSHQRREPATRPVKLTLLTPEAPTKEPASLAAAAASAASAVTNHRNVVKRPPTESLAPSHTTTATATTTGGTASDLQKITASGPDVAPSNHLSSPAGLPLKEGVQTVAQGVAPKPVSTPEAPAAVEPPLAAADYLHNPPPAYPSLSLRLQEQGQVVHRVLIGLDGKAISAQMLSSSGSERLDRAAREAIMQWRYVPGKRGGTPTVMSVDVPITWRLN